MSQQAAPWARYHAAALQTMSPENAALAADKALGQYNKRFETLAKHEQEMAELARTLEIRGEQVYIGTQALMLIDDFIASYDRNEQKVDSHWLRELRDIRNRHLHLQGGTYVTVVMGMNPDDPKLRNR